MFEFKPWLILPTVFDDALSYLEQLRIVCKRLNELGENQNQIQDVLNQLNFYIDNQLEADAKAQLEAWKNDGTLSQILNEELLSQINVKVDGNIVKTNENTEAITTLNNSINTANENITNNTKEINYQNKSISFTVIKLNRNGLAIYVKFYDKDGNRKNMLIDGGWNTNPNYPFYSSVVADPYPNAANDAEIVYNFLVNSGVTKIDYQIITHYHEDHIGGVGWCLEKNLYTSDTIFYLPGNVNWTQIGSNAQTIEDKGFEAQLKLKIGDLGATIVQPTNNQTIKLDDLALRFFNTGDAVYNLYYPHKAEYATESDFYNNFSLCTEFTYRNAVYLNTGDIQKIAQQTMTDNGYVRKADICLTPHHGYTDGYTNFLKTVNPEFWICSNALANAETISGRFDFVRYFQLGMKAYLTGDSGNFTFETKDGKFEVKTFCKPFDGKHYFPNVQFITTTNKTVNAGSVDALTLFSEMQMNYCFDTPILEITTAANGYKLVKFLEEGTYEIVMCCRAQPSNSNSPATFFQNVGEATSNTSSAEFHPLVGTSSYSAGTAIYLNNVYTVHEGAGQYIYFGYTATSQNFTLHGLSSGSNGYYTRIRIRKIG